MGGERLAIMRAVRAANVAKFRTTVQQTVEDTPFFAGQCIVLEVARAAATAFGLSKEVVTMVPLHNNWTSAEFTHEVVTQMPPPLKGRKREAPVVTRTKYMVVKASAKIRAYREFLETQEVEENKEGEVLVAELQRPNVTNPPPSDDSNDDPPSPPPGSSGGKNKKGKGKK